MSTFFENKIEFTKAFLLIQSFIFALFLLKNQILSLRPKQLLSFTFIVVLLSNPFCQQPHRQQAYNS